MTSHTMKMPFRIAVRTEIFNSLSEEFNTVEEALENLLTEFKDWKSYGARGKNHQEAFKQYLMCLPSSFNAEFTHHGIYEKLKKWFESVDAEYKEQDSDKEADLYYHLLYRELPHVYKAYGMEWRV